MVYTVNRLQGVKFKSLQARQLYCCIGDMKCLVLIAFLFGCANMTAAVASEKYMTEFYDTGQTKVEKTYKNGKLNGPFTMYFRDGRIMMQGTMKDGKKDGDWVVYYFNGEKSLYSSGVFRDGKWVAPSKN